MGTERLDWIDGLRGVAIGLVLIDHATLWWARGSPLSGLAQSLGDDGVSLFLVLSGLCLSLPAVRRQRQGRARRFEMRSFFLRRAWRIMPAYYVAVLLCALLSAALPAWYLNRGLPYMIARPTGVGIAEHLAFVQNLDGGSGAQLNPAFWSLGLEAQWYVVFPILLLAVSMAPRRTLAAVSTGGLVVTALLVAQAGDLGVAHSWLSGRLCEFTLGIVVARLVVAQWRCPGPAGAAALLLWAALHAAVLSPIGVTLTVSGVFYPLLGGSLAALVLAASRRGPVQSGLTWRPLVRLGEASYGIYLLHWPAVAVSGHLLARAPEWIGAPLVLAAGLALGAAYHRGVERPFLRLAARYRPQNRDVRRRHATLLAEA